MTAPGGTTDDRARRRPSSRWSRPDGQHRAGPLRPVLADPRAPGPRADVDRRARACCSSAIVALYLTIRPADPTTTATTTTTETGDRAAGAGDRRRRRPRPHRRPRPSRRRPTRRPSAPTPTPETTPDEPTPARRCPRRRPSPRPPTVRRPDDPGRHAHDGQPDRLTGGQNDVTTAIPGRRPTSASAAGGVVERELAGDQPPRVEPARGDQPEQLGIGVRGHPVAAEHLQLQAR